MTTTSTGTAKVTLPTDEQILITREFNAPKHLVYRVWTTPELIQRWWSGGMGEVTSVEIDLRVGGTWRCVLVSDGVEVGFHGEYREIVPNERIVSTEVYEQQPQDEAPYPDGEVVTTTTFTEVDGRTTLRQLIDTPSKDIRDAIINSGMEVGMQGQMDMVEQMAVSLGSEA